VRLIPLNSAADDFAVYGTRRRGPLGTPMLFRGSFDECLAFLRQPLDEAPPRP
jgi:hypothetical protein